MTDSGGQSRAMAHPGADARVTTDLRTDVRAALVAPPAEGPAGDVTAVFCFSPDFRGFQGHFPGNPVLPGIVQILMAEVTAGRGNDPALKEVARCKFLRPVSPGERVSVTAAPAGEGQWICDLNTGGERCALMTLIFAV